MKLVKEVYASWRAEVVFITSNRQGNQEIMEGCKEAGIPAFVSQAHYLRLMTTDFGWGSRERCGTSDEMSSAKHVHYLLAFSEGPLRGPPRKAIVHMSEGLRSKKAKGETGDGEERSLCTD